ncbi:MAG: hydrogenase nickel incorporation protein HypB [Spirochaetales bacterium]|nr:hydrogenase nickel incorporation protein HypB [Spirochaetales bacterium]
MKEVTLIEIKEEIHSENRKEAVIIRDKLSSSGTYMVNIMSSPGAGKTSLILKTIEVLKDEVGICVVEADLDSMVDAEKVAAAGVESLQMKTGGFCHVDAFMMRKSLDALDLERIDLLFLENVGNLICPAQADTGAHTNVVILSVPEGDDKPLKYPLIFRKCETLVVNKIDYLSVADFNMEALKQRARVLNPDINIIEVSCRTGEGIDIWVEWLRGKLRS